MLQPNIIVILLTASVPMIVGFIWYNPKTFGNAWMKAAGLDAEKMKGANMLRIFGLTFLFSFFIAFAMQGLVIHQFHLYSIVMGDPDLQHPDSELSTLLKNFYGKYGGNFRTFKHGELHGTIAGITIALPIIAINGLFERKGFKYVAINAGYWIITLGLMGGLICAYT